MRLAESTRETMKLSFFVASAFAVLLASACVAPKLEHSSPSVLYHPTTAWVESDPDQFGPQESKADRKKRVQREQARQQEHRKLETIAANRILSALEPSARVELLSLNPDPRIGNQEPKNTNLSEKFAGGYLITGRALTSDSREIGMLGAVLRVGFSEAKPESGECFEPRHGLVFQAKGRNFMAVICFACTQAYLCEVGKPESSVGLIVSQSPESTFDSIFGKHGLSKAP